MARAKVLKVTGVKNAASPPTLEELSGERFGINKAILLEPEREERHQKQHSMVEVVLALQKARGWVSIAAQLLHTTPHALHKRIRENEELRLCVMEIREHWLDHSEVMLFRNIDAGDQRAIEFHLSTLGKHRGWMRNYNMLNMVVNPALGTEPVIPQLTQGDVEHSPGGLDAGAPPTLTIQFVTQVNVNAPADTTGVVTAEERSGAVADTREV